MDNYYKIKIIVDLLGYFSGGIAGYLSFKYYFKKNIENVFNNSEQKIFYYLGILAGAMFLAILVSTFDNYVSGYFAKNFGEGLVLSKTIAGAIAGGVISSEIIKKIYKLDFNTGVVFVPSLIVGTIVGRIGAFLIGLRDNTHGLPTSLPWGYNYGNGVLRHPTQIYEILVLLFIGVLLVLGLKYKRDYWLRNGFFIFCLVYFLYRFFVGFIMPYSHFWVGMNSYQIISIGMIIYAVYKLIKFNCGK
ncbi:MAG: prolipoprotein diacylglyceryl transferase [Candidatus Gracilibacteria bacterium]|nr:prolipoprotein diacylglyceryl transferase [Candidatus Gracilibacteria bacterium]